MSERDKAKQPALEIVEQFGSAWEQHDLGAAMSFMHEKCIFESTGPAPDGIRSTGFDEVKAAWKPIFEDTSSQFEAEETFVAGDRVVQRWRYNWAEGHVRGVDVFKIEDGKITEKLSYVKG